MRNFLALFGIAALFFGGCSSKEYFKPVSVVGDWKNSGQSDVEVIRSESGAALLEDGKVLIGNSVKDVKLADGYRIIGSSKEYLISSNIDGNLTLIDFLTSKEEKFDLFKTIASASFKDGVLAVLFANNELALYDATTKALLFKEQGNPTIAVDNKIVAPYFKDEIVVFSTLDGKVVIVNAKDKKRLRTAVVSAQDNFNNIIYLNIVDNKIVSATNHKLLSLAEKEQRIALDIRSVTADGKNLFVATKQGEIISLTTDLYQNAKLKFPFAHFLNVVAHNGKIYALEKQGYLIEMTPDLTSYGVYKVDVDGVVYIADKIFYVDDEYISVE